MKKKKIEKNKKAKKIGKLEKFFIDVLPFSARTTKTLLVIFSIINYMISGMLFSETMQKELSQRDLAQNFSERVENTRSVR